MGDPATPEKGMISVKILVTAVGFGVAGGLLLLAGLNIPIIGTQISIDPHEIFITLGAAFAGPVGGAITALISDIVRPATEGKAIIVASHVIAGIAMGFAYKTLLYSRLKMPWMVLGWIGLVIGYYVVLIVPAMPVLLQIGAFPPELVQELGDSPLIPMYAISFMRGAPEIITTAVVTAIVLLLLPPKYRRPLW